MTSNRRTRPPLERDRPDRAWATLFRGSPGGFSPPADARPEGEPGGAREPASGQPFDGARPAGAVLGDTVEKAYQVIDEYMRQGQSFAQAFSPGTPAADPPGGAPGDMQQLAQRLMQYGWDFAGLWFEMWTRMSQVSRGSAGTPDGAAEAVVPPAPFDANFRPGDVARAKSAGATDRRRLRVCVVSSRTTTINLDLRSGPSAALVIHALSAEDADVPPIRDVTVLPSDEDMTVTIKVVVDARQPAGTYHGVIIDKASNLPHGTVSLSIHAGPA